MAKKDWIELACLLAALLAGSWLIILAGRAVGFEIDIWTAWMTTGAVLLVVKLYRDTGPAVREAKRRRQAHPHSDDVR